MATSKLSNPFQNATHKTVKLNQSILDQPLRSDEVTLIKPVQAPVPVEGKKYDVDSCFSIFSCVKETQNLIITKQKLDKGEYISHNQVYSAFELSLGEQFNHEAKCVWSFSLFYGKRYGKGSLGQDWELNNQLIPDNGLVKISFGQDSNKAVIGTVRGKGQPGKIVFYYDESELLTRWKIKVYLDGHLLETLTQDDEANKSNNFTNSEEMGNYTLNELCTFKYDMKFYVYEVSSGDLQLAQGEGDDEGEQDSNDSEGEGVDNMSRCFQTRSKPYTVSLGQVLIPSMGKRPNSIDWRVYTYDQVMSVSQQQNSNYPN